jgi:hypothetical protein
MRLRIQQEKVLCNFDPGPGSGFAALIIAAIKIWPVIKTLLAFVG